MITTLIFDFSRVLLFPKDPSYKDELNVLHKSLAREIHYSFLDHFELNEPLLKYLDSIKEKKQLYIFTSGSIQNAPEIRPRIDSIFRQVFSAEEIGHKKKEPEAYNVIMTAIGKKPEEILFIDDSVDNLVAAKIAHLNTLHYQDFEKFRQAVQDTLF